MSVTSILDIEEGEEKEEEHDEEEEEGEEEEEIVELNEEDEEKEVEEEEEEESNTGNNPQSPVAKTANEYASDSNLHGIAYFCEDGLLVAERILWVVIVILAFIIAILMTVAAYNSWQADPVLTSVGTTGFPIEEVDFPAITICSQGISDDIIDAALAKQFNDYLDSKGNAGSTGDTGRKILFSELTEEEMELEGYAFLQDMYPGVKQAPHRLVRLLGSPLMDPSQELRNAAILNPEDKKTFTITAKQSIE